MSKIKPRLGRGLSSLISVSDLPVEETVEASVARSEQAAASAASLGQRILEVPIDSVVANPNQPRRSFQEASLADLAASLKSTGVIQPVIVRPLGNDQYELIAGERRWRAARMAGLPTLPAIVRDVDSVTQAQMALIENVQREDLNPIERAQAYRELVTKLGLTHNELAGRLGEDRTSISHFIRLMDLPTAVQEMIRDGQLSMAHAKLLMSLSDTAEQERLADVTVSQSLSVRNLERLMSATPAKPAADKPAAAPSAHMQGLEKSIARQLGMRVQLRAAAQKGRGRLVIHYGSLDQFDTLMSKLGVATEE